MKALTWRWSNRASHSIGGFSTGTPAPEKSSSRINMSLPCRSEYGARELSSCCARCVKAGGQ